MWYAASSAMPTKSATQHDDAGKKVHGSYLINTTLDLPMYKSVLSPRGSGHRRIVLRGLSPIEHAVIPHHLKYTKVLGRRIGKKLLPKTDAGVR